MKKVLIISYYWPPAGGAGVRRPFYLANYLANHSIQPIILTVQNGQFQAIDYDLEKLVSPKVQVLKTSTLEPYGLFKKMTGQKSAVIESHEANSTSKKNRLFQIIRNNLFIPDPRIGWFLFAVQKAERWLKQEGISAIISSSPPPTVHLIAKSLSKKLKIPWIMDYRDPWSQNFRIRGRNPVSAYIDQHLENLCQKAAKHITLTSADFSVFIHPDFQKKIQIITNGFEPEKLLKAAVKEESNYRILHFGSISISQNPKNLLKGIATWNKEHKRKIELLFVGQFDPEIQKYIENKNFQSFVTFHQSVSQSEFHNYLSMAHIGLLCLHPYKNSTGNIPLKIFDYFKYQLPILSIGSQKGHVAEIINRESIGLCRGYSESINETDFMQLIAIQSYPDSIEKNYSWTAAGQKFSKLLEAL